MSSTFHMEDNACVVLDESGSSQGHNVSVRFVSVLHVRESDIRYDVLVNIYGKTCFEVK